jgi:type I restriction enzyme S subunit
MANEDLRARYEEICQPIFSQKWHLVDQNQILTRTRDLLLPRLISGKLSVEDLDIQLPPSMREEAAESRE